jgi:hypothetical protein
MSVDGELTGSRVVCPPLLVLFASVWFSSAKSNRRECSKTSRAHSLKGLGACNRFQKVGATGQIMRHLRPGVSCAAAPRSETACVSLREKLRFS